jgi:hypothetical protein
VGRVPLLHGEPGWTDESFECFDSYLPAAEIEYVDDADAGRSWATHFGSVISAARRRRGFGSVLKEWLADGAGVP